MKRREYAAAVDAEFQFEAAIGAARIHETLRCVSAAVLAPGYPRPRKPARKHVELDHEP